MTTLKPISGHTTPANAYVVDDYPYGFTLRCKIRYWLEFKPKFGYRLVSQTTNPKKSFEVWNKPKASTYLPVACMFLDEQGYVQWTGVSVYADRGELEVFRDTFIGHLDENAEKMLKALLVLNARELVRKAMRDGVQAH